MLRDRRVQYVVLFACAFALLPILLRNVIPYDMVENLYWGKEWQLGYDKHPPLFAWISIAFVRLCASIPESMYFLTQLNLLVGCFFIFKIAILIGKSRDVAFASVLFFLTSAASVFGNTKFNATTILFSLLPIVFYLFIRMIKLRKISDAVLFGIFAMLACIGKYFALLFLGCIGLFVLCDRQGRELLKIPLLYIALGIFLISISWHVFWMFQHDFVTLKYGLEKSLVTHLNRGYAFNFLMMLFLFFGTSFWALYVSLRDRSLKLKPYYGYSFEERFVLVITLAPMVIMFTMSLITGMRIGSFWCVNMLMLLGICFNILFRDIDFDKLLEFAKKLFAFFIIAMILQLGIGRCFWKHYDPSEAIDVRKVVHCIENDWYNCFGEKKILELHADKATSFLHAYLSDSPSLYDTKHLRQFKVFDTYNRPGIFLVTFLANQQDNQIEKFTNEYNDKIVSSGIVHVIHKYFVYYAFIEVIK